LDWGIVKNLKKLLTDRVTKCTVTGLTCKKDMTREKLQDRPIAFTVMISEISSKLNSSTLGHYISDQMTRSATSSALNYAEALGAESRKDFIHKARIVLKELRETEVSLRIVQRNNICMMDEQLERCIQENHELISIFWKTVATAQKTWSNPK
jgi:four helix bundle protein